MAHIHIGHLPIPILVTERQHAVREVAPGRHQFVVVARHELRPIPIAVLALGHVDGQVIAQGIRVEAGQRVASPDRPVARAADLLAFEIHELIGGHIIRQDQRDFFARENFHERASDAHQLSGPQRCVEEDVVLADEVELLRLRICPPIAPRIFLTRYLTPLNRGGEIADDCLEPHVEFFRFPTRLADRDGDAPIEVTGDGARLESLGFDLAAATRPMTVSRM